MYLDLIGYKINNTIQFFPLFLTATARFLLSLDTLIIGKLFSHVHNLKYVSIDQYHYKTQNSTFSSPFRVSKIIIIRRIFFFSCHSWNTSTLHFLGLIARVQHRKKISGGKKSNSRFAETEIWLPNEIRCICFQLFFDIRYNFRYVILTQNVSAEVKYVYFLKKMRKVKIYY